MLFYVKTVLKDRDGIAVRDPKPGETPKSRTQPNGQMQLYFEESQKRDALFGHVALAALDATVPTDRKEMEADAAKWVKAVARREDVADKVRVALLGDGWAEFPDDHRDMLVERLGQCLVIGTFAGGNAVVGPVVSALLKPPAARSRPEDAEAGAGPAGNGLAPANDAQPAVH